ALCTSSVDVQCAALTSVYHRVSATFVSGCLLQNATSVFRAITLMVGYLACSQCGNKMLCDAPKPLRLSTRATSRASLTSSLSSFPRRSQVRGGCEMTNSNYALRLPASLKRAVEEVAREDGTTLNQFIVSAVAEKLAALKTANYFAKRAARADFAVVDR